MSSPWAKDPSTGQELRTAADIIDALRPHLPDYPSMVLMLHPTGGVVLENICSENEERRHDMVYLLRL